jgi:tetratricopeptide (TPR) repeat protein
MTDILNESINLSQTGLLYNPQLQDDKTVEKLFVVRQKQFELLLNKILQEKEGSIPQHYLIIGQRGMGKTMLLKRMEVELHKEQYRQRFIPLLYREEQYNVKDLAEFWLNTLDALADSLQAEKYSTQMVADIDKTIMELSKKPPKIISEEAYKYLMDICCDLHRRPVLLIDNIGLIFGRLDNDKKSKPEQWALRKLLSENGAPIVVSGGVTLIDNVNNYGMPFYDFFQIQQLYKLNYEEFTKLLINLATITNRDKTIFDSINDSRQKSLLELTGGSPRLTVILFEQIAKGFSSNIYDDLEKLADSITPFYKARFEELSTQQQIIIDAIALNWDAISLKKLSTATRMQNNQLSPQLKRLVDDGWIETTPAYKAKGKAYFISERFFNIYYLIRNSSRRHKDKVYCLSRFLECFYGKEELEKISDILLKQSINSSEHMRLYLALSGVKTLELSQREKMLEKTFEIFLNNEELRKEFDFSEDNFKSKVIFLIKSKQYSEAINYINKIINIIKYDEYAWFWKGYCLYKIQQYKEAINCYNKTIEINKNNENAWLGKGICLYKMQQYEEAINCYNKTIEMNKNNENAWFGKGMCLYEIRQYEEAINCYNKYIELDSRNENAWYWKGKCLSDMGQYKVALNCLNKSIKLDSKNEDAWLLKSECLFLMGQCEEAIDCCNKVIKLNLKNEVAWFGKGACLSDMKQYKEAIDCFNKTIDLDSKNKEAWNLKGICLSNMEQYEKAIDCFNKVIELDSKNKDAWLLKGIYLSNMERYEEAIDCFNKIIELDPKNENAWYFKVKCLSDMGQYEEALDCFDKAIELKQKNSNTWSCKGDVLIELQKYTKAVNAYEQSIEIDPKNLSPIFNLIFLYRDKLGEINKAIELFNSIDENKINKEENINFACRYYLHKALFELYKKNNGFAREYLLQAFVILEKEDKISSVASMYWWIRFGAIVINLGCGSWLISILEEKGYNIILSPYYTAIQALEIERQEGKTGKKDAEIYLNNRAVEISDPAKIIVEKMKEYL